MFNRTPRSRCCRLEPLEKRQMLSVGADLLSSALRPGAASVRDDYGNTFTQATQITLSTSGSGSQSGKIETSGDVDVFKFVATATGTVTIQQSATTGSRLDSYVYVYNAKQQLLAGNDDVSRGNLNSQVQINVVAGATYYIKAAAYRSSTGAYAVQIATAATTTPTDDYGNTIADATLVSLSTTGSGAKSGTIEKAGDVDMFKIVATVTGTITVQQSAASGSQLRASLAAYDASGNVLATNASSSSSTSGQVQFSVVAGTTYYVKAAGNQSTIGAYALGFSTAAVSDEPTDDGGFQITATITGMTTAAQQIIQQAIDCWENVIVGDLPDVTYRGQVIDDIQIAISGITIDGSGNILGQSTATAYRNDSGLPYAGYIQLDTADVATMLSDGSLLGVVTHEIAHVLGFGVIWSDLGLLVGSNTSNPGFTGANAVAAYNAVFGTNVTSVPVEAEGGSGTRLSHWDESVFDNELMTGWYNSGEANPLSRITIASMADLGYQVNMAAAEAYAPSSSSITAAAALATSPSQTSRTFGSFNTRVTQSRWSIANVAAATDDIFLGATEVPLGRVNGSVAETSDRSALAFAANAAVETHHARQTSLLGRKTVSASSNLWNLDLTVAGDGREAVDSTFAELANSEAALDSLSPELSWARAAV